MRAIHILTIAVLAAAPATGGMKIAPVDPAVVPEPTLPKPRARRPLTQTQISRCDTLRRIWASFPRKPGAPAKVFWCQGKVWPPPLSTP